MAKTAPSPVDVVDFQFKLQCRLKVFENDSHDTFQKPCSLISAASRFGLLFVGTSSPKFQVIEIQSIQNYTVKDGDVANYKRRNVILPSAPKYLSVNCDATKLCVVVEKDSCVKAVIYDVSSFLKQNVSILQEIRLSVTPGVNITDLSWNPSVPSMLVACKDDGTLGLYEIKENGIEIKELPKTTAVSCACWSPKGKQIVVGSGNGKLIQYKLDLQVARIINPPPINGNPYPISLQWISNYQFIAVYKTNGDDSQMSLIVVDAPKNIQPSYTSYDDVCYSYGNARPHQFYMLQQSLWGILLVASSNSMEVGVMHLEKDTWTQWILTDSARAELPLSAIKQDTLPVGMAFDISSTKPVPWGENQLPPAPYLFLLSHQGVLCWFCTLNLKQDAPKICTPPETLSDRSGLVNFTMGESEDVNPAQVNPVMSVVKPTPVAQTTAPVQQPFPAFGTNVSTMQSAMFATPTVISSQKIQTPTPTFFSKPITSGSSLFGSQTQPFATLKTDCQPTMVTKPQVEIKKPETTMESVNSQKPVVPKPVITQQQVKQIPAADTKATPPQKSAVSGIPAINAETEKLLTQMMKEECVNLDLEINVLLTQGSSIKVDLGSDTEATSIVEGVTALQDFLKEMNETSTAQAAEIHILKQNLIQTWVWYEEARSRFATYKDPALKSLLLAQPLDAASERKLDEIRHLIYYLESQLVQANAALDDQWETFQDSCKKKLSARVPNIEAIYQVMVKQNATLQKQVYILKDISMRIRSKLKNINTPRLLVSLDSVGELEEQLKSLHVEPKDLIQIRYAKVLKRQRRLSKIRVDKLKEYFVSGNVSHVIVRKPQNNSLMQMSGLGVTPFSPIAPKKTQREERFNFIQSTPLPEVVNTNSIVMESKVTPSVVVNLFKQEPKSVGGDVKTSAFVPMVSAKSSFFGTGSLEPSTLINKKTQKAVVENVAKPSLFNIIPANSPVITQKSSSSSFFGNTEAFDTTSKTITNEISNKSPATSSLGVSVNLIKSSNNEMEVSKSNTFMPFAMPSTQNFNFVMNKSDGSITPGVSIEKVSAALDSKITTESDGAKTLFSSIFGQSLKQSDVSYNTSGNLTKLPTTTLGDKNIFTQNIMVTTSGSKVFSMEKSPAIFGQIQQTNTDQFKATVASTIITCSKNIVTTATTAPSSITQIFASNVGQTETSSNMLGQMPAMSSRFGFQSSLPTTSSSVLLGQAATSTSSINATMNNISNQQSLTTAMQKASVLTAAMESTCTTIPANSTNIATTTMSVINVTEQLTPNVSSQTTTILPAFGQLTTTAAAMVGSTTTTSIFMQPVTTTKSVEIVQSIGISPAAAQNTTITAYSITTATLTASTPSAFKATSETSPFAQTTSTTSILRQTPTSVLGLTTATPVLGQPTTQTSFIFAKPVSTFGQSTVGTSTVFGQTPLVFSSPATTTASIFSGTTTAFAQSTTTATAFGQTSTSTVTSDVFGQSTISSSIFGQPSSPSSSLFGQTTSTLSIFGQATSKPSVFEPTTAISSAFGQTSLAQTSTPSVFGTATVPSSVFGQTTSPPTEFGQVTATPTVFGQATSTPSVFGQPASTPSIFGQQASTPSIFGQKSSTPTVFGQTTTTTSTFGQSSAPIFGQPTTSPSVFGQQQSIFGQPTTSAFGQSSTTTSIFGQPTTSTPAAFGQSVFGNNSIFKTSTNNVFGGSPFGQTSTTAPVFGSPSPFGSANIFGGNTANNNVFGKPAFGTVDNLNFGVLNTGGGPTTTTATTNIFGSSSFNAFRAADKEQSFNTTSNVFESGSTTSTPPIFGNSPFSKTTPAFGGPATFGSSPTFSQPSGFGSTFGSNTSFGSPNQPGPFSGSNNAQTVSQSGFCSPTTFQKQAFGSQPPFGSQPSGFGAPPTFGASSFSGSASFGSPNRVFGSTETFATAPQQQSSTFANLANQPTIGFGSVAQQAPVENMQQPSFAGGSSFTSWR